MNGDKKRARRGVHTTSPEDTELTGAVSVTTIHAGHDRERWFGATQYSAARRAGRAATDPWPVYDVITLGLAPHDRGRCAECQVVGR